MEDGKQEDKLLQAMHLTEQLEHSRPGPDLPVTHKKHNSIITLTSIIVKYTKQTKILHEIKANMSRYQG